MKTCSDELKPITVSMDERDANGDMVCNEPGKLGETLEGDSDTLATVLCESGLKHGTIKSSSKDGPEVNCDNMSDRVTRTSTRSKPRLLSPLGPRHLLKSTSKGLPSQILV
jgi:hypothetical protein